MATPTIKTKGFKALFKRIEKLPAAIRTVAETEIKKSTLRVHRDAQRIVPVRFGRLKSSLRFEVAEDGLTGEVFTNVEYAAFVEFGTVNMRERPYLFPAWNTERPKLLKRLREVAGKRI